MTFEEIVIRTFSEMLGDYVDRFDPAVLAERVRLHIGVSPERFRRKLPNDEAQKLLTAFRGEFPGILNWMLKNKILLPT